MKADYLNGIRVRGREMNRVEFLSDAVFGFALTLLVVSLEIPQSFADLQNAMMHAPAFACSLLAFGFIWHCHYRFFRQFGLETNGTMWLNGVMLFLILLFVYPLKYLSTVLISFLVMHKALGIPIEFYISISLADAPALHIIYSLGFGAIFFCLTLFYVLARHNADALDLDASERLAVTGHIWAYGVVVAVALISTFLVIVCPPAWQLPAAGFVYWLIWPIEVIIGRHFAGREKRLLSVDQATSS